MAGFGGSTGVSKGYVDRAISQSTANTSLTEQVTLSSGYDTSVFDSVAYRIASGTVLVYAVVKAGLPAGWYNDKVTGLPSKVKPYLQVMGSHRIASAADAAKDIFATLNTDLTIQVYISAATNAAVAFSFTYPFG